MDQVLIIFTPSLIIADFCLNPCYNGLGINTKLKIKENEIRSLNPCYNGLGINMAHFKLFNKKFCLNPCYNGLGINLKVVTTLWGPSTSLNPCYNGLGINYSKTKK